MATAQVEIGALGEEQEFELHFGGIDGKYSFASFEYSTPVYKEDTWTVDDTINSHFNVVLMDKDPNTSASHIRDQNRNGFLTKLVKFFIGDSFDTPAEQELARKRVDDYGDLEP